MVLIPGLGGSSGGISLSESAGQGSSAGQSFGQQGSSQAAQASSTSFIPNYSQTPILESIAQYAENMAPQVYQWGMNQWGNNQHDINGLMRTADTYASGQRLATDVGMAEAGVQQAGEQGLEASKADLESYGIDPSSGRYAALDQASRVKTAAAAAGAGNQQRMADIATGNAMKNQAISAELQNSAYGNQVSDTMNNLLGTGIRLPYSPLGTASQSSSQGYSYGMNESTNQSQNTSGSDSISLNQGAMGGAGAGAGGAGAGGARGGGGAQRAKDPFGSGAGTPGGSSGDWMAPGGAGGGGNSGPGVVGGFGGGADSGLGGAGYSGFDLNDPSGLGLGDYPNSYDLSPSSQYYDPYSAYPSGDIGPAGFDPYTSPTPASEGDWSNPTTYSGDTWTGGGDTGGGGDYGYAGGGPVANGYDPEEDGPSVSPDMSPSDGQQTDDVPAKLNAGEFVMPADVKAWKGEEFFQNLIAKSRQARASIMQANGQMQGRSMNMGGAI